MAWRAAEQSPITVMRGYNLGKPSVSPQHGGHSHSVEGVKPKQGFVFCTLFVACRGYTTYSQHVTTVYSVCCRNCLENLSFCIIHRILGGKTFLVQVFKHFWRDISIKQSVYFSFVKDLLRQVFKHFWRDISIKLSVYFSFVKELLLVLL